MAAELTFAERRVLGVLIEKGFTTPEQYPLSQNAVVVGSNQKSCREPLSSLDEEQALTCLESLRKKGFATLVRIEGSRVDRWKHRFGESLALDAKEVALLAELLLRGPQTDGELRQRVSRMRPLESLEEVEQLIDRLASRPEPLVARLGPPGRKRGVKYAHTFYSPSERPRAEEEGGYEAAERSAPPQERVQVRFGAQGDPPPEPRPSIPPRHDAALPTPPVSPGGSAGADVLSLRREIESLKERVEELEATFARFLR